MGGSPAEKNAVSEFLHFGETSPAFSEVSPGGRNHGWRNPLSFAISTVWSPESGVRVVSRALVLRGGQRVSLRCCWKGGSMVV